MPPLYVTLRVEPNLETADPKDWVFTGPNGELCQVVDSTKLVMPNQEFHNEQQVYH